MVDFFVYVVYNKCRKGVSRMLLTETCFVVFDRAVTYIDALSVTAAVLIVLFVVFVCVREHRKNKKYK